MNGKRRQTGFVDMNRIHNRYPNFWTYRLTWVPVFLFTTHMFFGEVVISICCQSEYYRLFSQLCLLPSPLLNATYANTLIRHSSPTTNFDTICTCRHTAHKPTTTVPSPVPNLRSSTAVPYGEATPYPPDVLRLSLSPPRGHYATGKLRRRV